MSKSQSFSVWIKSSIFKMRNAPVSSPAFLAGLFCPVGLSFLLPCLCPKEPAGPMPPKNPRGRPKGSKKPSANSGQEVRTSGRRQFQTDRLSTFLTFRRKSKTARRQAYSLPCRNLWHPLFWARWKLISHPLCDLETFFCYLLNPSWWSHNNHCFSPIVILIIRLHHTHRFLLGLPKVMHALVSSIPWLK